MHIIDIILKKRNGGVLSHEEISYFVNGYVDGSIPDYQISSLLMAIWFRGMDPEETAALTLAMRDSGDTVDLSGIPGIKVDKHSTGGVADTTTLVAAPIVAACGGRVAKMSGRGLGHTGGTIDKLESIPGFSTEQSFETFSRIVRDVGLSIIGQTANLVPADKKLYALRDVTGTVDNISLIASSIMSKKLAAGSDAIVLDVKTGSGAFMKTIDASVKLAEIMVDIGKKAGKRIVALVTDMNQPLGNAVGNALEVREAIEILSGMHEGDLKAVSLALAARMIFLSGLSGSVKEAESMAADALDSGKALASLAAMIEAQGGDPNVTRDTGLLPEAASLIPVYAGASGYVTAMHTEEIGVAALLLGAGRMKKEDRIDPAVGIWLSRRIGDPVAEGEPLAVFHVNSRASLAESVERFRNAVVIGSKKPEPITLIHRVIGDSD
ncbi:MAG TPA: pyrimidine-nucleoside phosphorylase [Spirochaetia bacterium]|nr:pyrimidine-nucleoside phosphorylase [Spirochaetia bacterium]